MMTKSILVHLIGLPPDENTFRSAISAGRLLDAGLEVLHVHPDPVVIAAAAAHPAGGVTAPEVYQSLEDEFLRRAETAKDLYTRTTATKEARADGDDSEHIAMSFAEETGNVARIVADRARFADLTVLTSPTVDVDARIVETAETVLFESGRPILFIPFDNQTIRTDNVVIGWDGSPHATRTVVDAIPLLLTAKNVTILTIAKAADDQHDPARLRDMLERHGVPSALETITTADNDAGQTLLDIGESDKADILVVGGYGKHPMREFIFGGATRTLLNNASIPLFMAH